jgi:hypothetical protein
VLAKKERRMRYLQRFLIAKAWHLFIFSVGTPNTESLHLNKTMTLHDCRQMTFYAFLNIKIFMNIFLLIVEQPESADYELEK